MLPWKLEVELLFRFHNFYDISLEKVLIIVKKSSQVEMQQTNSVLKLKMQINGIGLVKLIRLCVQ